MTTTVADPFSDLAPGADGLAEGRRRYRDLSKRWHPDANGGHGPAHDAMATLNAAWEAAEARLSGKVASVVVTSRRHTYTVLRPLLAGDVADLHVAEVDGDEVLLKVARSPKDADLLAAEVATLKSVHAADTSGYNGWFPIVSESFAFAAPGKPRRRCNVLGPLHGFYNLAEVDAAKRSVHSRDVAWIARRILHALAMTHEAGRVHGGVVPEHVMVHPTEHRVVLVGWGGSVADGEPLKVRVTGRAAWYPPETEKKAPTSPATDLYLFGRTLEWLASGRLESSRRLATFGRGCAMRSRKGRPKDAHEVLGEFDDLLERMWGARTYHEFSMPGPSRI